ncbi:MAG: phosphotransacetylase family protein [Candidatus Helarchaeales archaeon]
MKKLMVTSRGRFAGKTATCIGLGLVLKENGYNVGYFKPIGRKDPGAGDEPDYDAVMLKKIFKLDDDPRDICPVQLDRQFAVRCMMDEDQKEVFEAIDNALEKLEAKHDIILIEGQRRNEHLSSIGLSNPIVCKHINAKAIIITSGDDYTVLDDIYLQRELFKLHDATLLGLIFNNIRRHMLDLVKEDFTTALKSKMNLEVYGIIPMDVKLIAPTVREIYKIVGGQILEGNNPEALGRLVENTLVGAMNPENAIRFFQRSVNNCIITGGDRPDLILSALELDTTSLVICTGGLYPPIKVLVRARERNIPIIQVPYDTNTTSRMVQKIRGYMSADNTTKINLAREKIANYVDWKALIDAL